MLVINILFSSETFTRVLPFGNIGRTGNVQFNNDPAILEIGKGMLAEILNNASFDMRRSLLHQFSPGEHDARLMLLMQQSILLREGGLAISSLVMRMSSFDSCIHNPLISKKRIHGGNFISTLMH